MQAPKSGRVLPAAEFADAVKSGWIEPHFQPIVHADTRKLKGFEALARLQGSGDTCFATEYLSQMAEDYELSALLTDLVIDRSFAFMERFTNASELTISINIFGSHAVADGFRECLIDRCATYGIARERVILELSEAAVFDFNEHDLRKITQLRLAGFGLAIDDFGIGHSSLGRLAGLPFSELKIDKSFGLALPGCEVAEAVIEACIGLAQRLDMTVTAEGVESAATAGSLAKMGCDALQGHYFGHAMPAEAAISLSAAA